MTNINNSKYECNTIGKPIDIIENTINKWSKTEEDKKYFQKFYSESFTMFMNRHDKYQRSKEISITYMKKFLSIVKDKYFILSQKSIRDNENIRVFKYIDNDFRTRIAYDEKNVYTAEGGYWELCTPIMCVPPYHNVIKFVTPDDYSKTLFKNHISYRIDYIFRNFLYDFIVFNTEDEFKLYLELNNKIL
jgi:hypothetical protein